MASAGFSQCESRSVEHLATRDRAGEALARGRLDQQVTSQLSLLSAEAYQAGLQKIRAALAAAEERGEELWLETDLELYGTFGVRT